jgi:hypothetical protein
MKIGDKVKIKSDKMKQIIEQHPEYKSLKDAECVIHHIETTYVIVLPPNNNYMMFLKTQVEVV